ncbi:thioredoxin-like domain-containing protein [Sulfuriflexus mobilis]|uniref:thioredoxin-like domain-containing protein n=1 Tax=Sulfuriflexus mobilis TaxID=1811807 RepID=UPI000F8179A9|nr:thioredoxin-like domain-containing protein [Sulfuriflexus mobilis]
MNAPRVRAPELPDTLQWFNTDGQPIKLADLRGKVVLLDFWTYCCVNCMHILPDLAWLERRYPDTLTVIGVHTPKFPNERIGENVQKAVNRHYIRHPVAHDASFSVWQQYGIKAWPTVIYIDPEGYIVGALRGEGRRKQLDQMIAKSIKEAEEKGTLRRSATDVKLWPEPQLELKFPGKVLATSERLFISDSGHNRVLECMPNGRIVRIYGSGAPGQLDGMEVDAAFDNPQGLACINNNLYIADTGNHLIRKIDLVTHEVTTIAGSGKIGRVKSFEVFVDPLKVPLNSPWDLTYHNGALYIAMAGAHQIWLLDLAKSTLQLYAGSGAESIENGNVETATFAQPSGLAIGEDLESMLFIADAESSAIRTIRLRDNYVNTVVGKGLFDFGEKDGKGSEALMQHPMGVAFDPKRKALWVADSFNHHIRHIKVSNNTVSSLKLAHPLAEPGGLSLHGDTLWIANTNAHNIVKIDINSGDMQQVEIFSVEND